jgi:hypothetical protein
LRNLDDDGGFDIPNQKRAQRRTRIKAVSRVTSQLLRRRLRLRKK